MPARAPTIIFTLGLLGPAAAADPTADFWSDDDPEARALAVNEGELELLAQPPGKPVHHHHNEIFIEPGSLRTGWVRLEQCHEHLDPVPALEIVYHPERIRKLRVLSLESVGQALVVDHSIQLEDVRPGGRICVSAESRALSDLGEGRFELRNGPFMRRFLDGYYPMRVSMAIHHPEDVRLHGHEPGAQPGFDVLSTPGQVTMDAWFEGKLYTRFRFCAEDACPP
ncbi:MAG: alpha/beta hydrolase [Chromatiales bacterium]|jgi:hypothetical protein